MIIKIITIIILTLNMVYGAQSDPSTPPLPTMKVLPINEQEDLYVKAYQQVGPMSIDPFKTHIPGLEPMVRMQYSFVRQVVEKSPHH